MRRNKTNCQRVGEFGSRAEARRYQELEILASVGKISNLSPHPRFRLEVNEMLIGHYTADSSYIEDGVPIIEEVKGWKSRDYPLRKKLFIALYPHLTHREIAACSKKIRFRRSVH